ncbi:MAG: hypothetical protein CL666_07420 [Balneola sp.]|nr:hypothetical protein [Balneola sp.]|tara:strand:- start:31640 stop:35395 length:3756 start_codon:yes stop_codon:yes gene_type:complete
MNKIEEIFRHSPFGFSYGELIVDDQGIPSDYLVKNVNKEFEHLSETQAATTEGKNASGIGFFNSFEHNSWLHFLGQIGKTDGKASETMYNTSLKEWVLVQAWFDENEYLAITYTPVADSSENIDSPSSVHFREVFDRVPHSVFVVDVTENHRFRINDFNEVQTDYLNMDRDEIQGKFIEEVFPKEVANSIIAHYNRCIESGEKITYEEDVILPGRGRRQYLTTVSPIKNKQGNIHRLVGSSMETTDRKKAEQALRKSEEQYRSFVQNSSEGIHLIEFTHPIDLSLNPEQQIAQIYKKGYVSACNDVMAKMYGYEHSEDLVDTNLLELHGSDDNPDNIEYLKNVIEHNYQLKDQLSVEMDVDGNEVYFMNNVHGIIEDDQLVRVWASQRDVTEQKKAEKSLRRTEALQNKMVSNIGDVIVIIDKNGNNRYKSPNIEKHFGWKPEELVGKNSFSLIHPEDRDKAQLYVNHLQKNPDEKVSYEIRYQHKNGEYLWINFTAVNLMDDPDVQGILGNYHDITEQKEAREALIREQEFNDALLKAATDGIVASDENGDLVLFNETAKDWHGIDLRKIPIEEGSTYYDLYHIDGETPLEPHEIPLVRAFKGETVQNAGMAIAPKGQPARYILASGSPVVGENGKQLGAVVLMRDVTERLETEQKLLENEERLTATLRSIGDGVITCDRNGNVVSVNQVAERLTGWKSEEAKGHDIDEVFNIINSKTREKAINPVQEALNKGVIVGLANHTILISKEGTEFQIADSCAPIKGKDDEILGCVLVFRDVTKEYKQREDLRKSEERFKALAYNVPGVIYLCKNDERYSMTFINHQVERLTGYSSEAFMDDNISFTELYHPEDKEWIIQEVDEALAEQRTFQLNYRIRHKDGEYRWVLEHGTGIYDEDGTLLYLEGYLTDITEQKEAEELVYKASQQLEFHINNSPLAVIISDENFHPKQWSESAEELFGWTEEEVWQMDSEEWTFTHEDDLNDVRLKMKELMKGEKSSNLSRNRNYTKSGDIIHCEWYNSAMFDQDGNIISIFSLVHDVSDRKEKEQQLEESLTEKETLLSEIHHRVKNNLAVVSGMMQLQAYDTANEELQTKLFDSVIRIKTMASVHELLYQSNSFSRLDFSDTIVKLVENISETLQTVTEINLDIECEHISLNINKAIPASLIVNEVVTNIYKHAFEGRQEGDIVLRVKQIDDEVLMNIKDNGVGFDVDQAVRSGSLGMHLIRELTGQIEGKYEYNNTSTGTEFILRFNK